MNHFLGQNPMSLTETEQGERNIIAEDLIKAYFAELETAMNYIAIVNNADGWNGSTLRSLLEEDIQEEFGHAQQIANRLMVLGYSVPSSLAFRQSTPTDGQARLSAVCDVANAKVSDLATLVMAAERDAMNLYLQIIEMSKDIDPVTADLVTHILADEEEHYRVMARLLR